MSVSVDPEGVWLCATLLLCSVSEFRLCCIEVGVAGRSFPPASGWSLPLAAAEAVSSWMLWFSFLLDASECEPQTAGVCTKIGCLESSTFSCLKIFSRKVYQVIE